MKKRTWLRKFKYPLIVLAFMACVVLFLEIGESKNSVIKSWLYGNKTTRELAVATVAMTPDVNPALSLKKMTGFIGRIKEAHPDVDLIFFGEAILGWFKSGNRTYHEEIAEPVPGRTTLLLARLAKENSVYLSFGVVEKHQGRVYNSQVLISDQGEILLTQRKKNVRSEGFGPGRESIALVDIKGVKVGIVVCYDIQSQETLRKAKNNRADVILLSNADYLEKWDKDYFGFRHMAKRFDAWIVTSNRYGVEDKVDWDGHIEILNPFGDVFLSGKKKEQYLFYKLNINADQSRSQRFLRRVYLRISLWYLVLKHLKTALSYL